MRLRLLSPHQYYRTAVHVLVRGQIYRLVGNCWIRPLPLIHGQRNVASSSARRSYINVGRLKSTVCSGHTDLRWHSVRRVNEDQLEDQAHVSVPVKDKSSRLVGSSRHKSRQSQDMFLVVSSLVDIVPDSLSSRNLSLRGHQWWPLDLWSLDRVNSIFYPLSQLQAKDIWFWANWS